MSRPLTPHVRLISDRLIEIEIEPQASSPQVLKFKLTQVHPSIEYQVAS